MTCVGFSFSVFVWSGPDVLLKAERQPVGDELIIYGVKGKQHLIRALLFIMAPIKDSPIIVCRTALVNAASGALICGAIRSIAWRNYIDHGGDERDL